MRNADEKPIRDYRQAIREAWLPTVGRQQLTSYEYILTSRWHAERVPVEWIIKAIERCRSRNEGRGTLYSLGVIIPDLEHVKREQAKLLIGHAKEALGRWRLGWAESLEEIASLTDDPEYTAAVNELKEMLPGLTREQAEQRWKEIAKK